MNQEFANPFRPGAGHQPPYLAGRQNEQREFDTLLNQNPVLSNLVLTGLRGLGKTVLLDTFRPIALSRGWIWAGTDLSESASVSEEMLCIRIISDLSAIVSSFTVHESERRSIGFISTTEKIPINLGFDVLTNVFRNTPGLPSDKLKAVLELVWKSVEGKANGIVLAYDEAQNLSDQGGSQQYPLSMLLDVFQSMQRKGIPYLLVLTGLPTLFPKLVDARTYAERMFHVLMLDRLNKDQCRDAILKPIMDSDCPVRFTNGAVNEIIADSGGYPYFVQFLCKEAYDSYLQQISIGITSPVVTIKEVMRKLDSDFFAGRWNRVTDRQRDLLAVIAKLPNAEEEFTVQEIAERSKTMEMRNFSPSQINQMLNKLAESGLIYKNRHGKYSFAVPMLSQFINRLPIG